MFDDIEYTLNWMAKYSGTETLIYFLSLIAFAWFANAVLKHILIKAGFRFLDALPIENAAHGHKFIERLVNVLPAMVISVGIALVPGVPPVVVNVLQSLANAFIVLTIALAMGDALDIVNFIYQKREDANLRPIKGYVQVGKIIVYVLAIILIIAALLDRSPVILLSGLGAMAAVLMLIFQDTILSLVASLQITSNDLVRVGDWIEMPQLNADGDVVDVALHTVKVQNWDKTITTIPTKRLISESFINWRGMKESGGRRIKRSIYIDQNSIHFLDTAFLERLRSFSILQKYLEQKTAELETWNRKLAEQGFPEVNARRVTNVGTFRAYVEQYLRNHPRIRQDMTLLVRQLDPTPQGLPLEIYCFTKTVAWSEYEAIQSDIFDHLLAIIDQFDLRVFQSPSGNDLRQWQQPLRSASPAG
ncbi:MAG TPA: mechanosensitive ion channel domain-containing protein [Methylophilaceae bacterium]|nr:mechanosensitive ion channel domain-containing protein [Methylophilaceae bacterium]